MFIASERSAASITAKPATGKGDDMNGPEPRSVRIAYLHGPASDTHQSPALPQLFVVCMSGIANLWCGALISRAIAVSDRHELG
jgi:hypothetical protein